MSDESSSSPKTGCVCWVEIPVQDMARAEKFYGNVFEWNFSHSPNFKEGGPVFYRIFSKADIPTFGGGLRLVTKENHITASDIPQTTFANRIVFAVKGIEEALQSIEKEGGKRVEIGEGMGCSASFRDTEGNINSIFSMKE